jgi:hypothetical protein
LQTIVLLLQLIWFTQVPLTMQTADPPTQVTLH